MLLNLIVTTGHVHEAVQWMECIAHIVYTALRSESTAATGQLSLRRYITVPIKTHLESIHLFRRRISARAVCKCLSIGEPY